MKSISPTEHLVVLALVVAASCALICAPGQAHAQSGALEIEPAEPRPERTIEVVDDLKERMEDTRYQGRTSWISAGVQLGIAMRQFWPFGPGISLGDGAPKRYPEGVARHLPVEAWLQLTRPLLATRRGWLFGLENESTVGASFARDLEEQRSLIWSTRWHASLSIPIDWGDEDVLTLFGGAQVERAPRYWWMAGSRQATHGSFGVRINYMDSSDGIPAEYGYDYQPLLSPLDGNVLIDGAIVGVPTHATHRFWLDPTEGFRISYIHRRMRFFDDDLPVLRTHEFLLTLHI